MAKRVLPGLCAVFTGAVLLIAGTAPAGATTGATTGSTSGETGTTTASPQALGPPAFDATWAGYQASGRWFRYVATTVTVPAPVLPAANRGSASITLTQTAPASARITVAPGGGPHSVSWIATGHAVGRFHLSPEPGDQLALDVYYDQHGNDYFTATDLTQHVTQVVRVSVGPVTYDGAQWAVAVAGKVTAPQADVRLWQFSGSHLTTYSGDRGSVTGPWLTSTLTATQAGTAKSTFKASPSFLWASGQDFGVWLRSVTAYVADVAGTVTPIDITTGTALPPIPAGGNPDSIAITPDGTTAYVGNQGDGTVTPIDTATNTALPAINVGFTGGLPLLIAITPDGRTAYVRSGNDVIPIDTATNTALAPIPIPSSEDASMAITPNGKFLYVTTAERNTLTRIDIATNHALPPITLNGPGAIAFSPDSATAYIATVDAVTPVDTATGAVLPSIPVNTGIYSVAALALTPDGATLYAASFTADTITPIDTATGTALTPLPLAPGGGPVILAMTPNGATLYVLYQGISVVTPIDTATGTVLPPIPVSAGASAIALTPDGRTAYVAEVGVTPIDTRTNTALTPIPAGVGPIAIAITP